MRHNKKTKTTNLVKVVVDSSTVNSLGQQRLEGFPRNFVRRQVSTSLEKIKTQLGKTSKGEGARVVVAGAGGGEGVALGIFGGSV